MTTSLVENVPLSWLLPHCLAAKEHYELQRKIGRDRGVREVLYRETHGLLGFINKICLQKVTYQTVVEARDSGEVGIVDSHFLFDADRTYGPILEDLDTLLCLQTTLDELEDTSPPLVVTLTAETLAVIKFGSEQTRQMVQTMEDLEDITSETKDVGVASYPATPTE